MNTAVTHKACDGCQYQSLPSSGGWCYLFKSPPESLPDCTQHNRNKPIRQAFAKSGLAKLICASAAFMTPDVKS